MTVATPVGAWHLHHATAQAPLDAALCARAEASEPGTLLVVVRSREMEDRVRALLPFPALVERLGAFIGAVSADPITDDDLLPPRALRWLVAEALPPHYQGRWRDHMASEHLAAIQTLEANGVRPPYPGRAQGTEDAELETVHAALLQSLAAHNARGRYAAFQRVTHAQHGSPRIQARHPTVRRIALFGIDWLSPAEERALEHLLDGPCDVDVYALARAPRTTRKGRPVPEPDRRFPALAHTDRFAQWAAYWSTHQTALDETTPHRHGLERLFSLTPHERLALPDVHVHSPRDPDEQARAIARHIHQAHEDGTPWEQIAIVAARLERHLPALRDALDTHGIPYTARADRALAATPPGTLLDLILADLEHDHERDHVIDLALHPLARWRQDDGIMLHPHRLRKRLARYGMRPRGRDGWARAFERLRNSGIAGQDDASDDARRRDREWLDQQETALFRLLDALDRVHAATDADATFAALRTLLEDLGIARGANRAMRRAHDPRALARAFDALLDLIDATQRATRIHHAGIRPNELLRVLRQDLHEALVPIQPDRTHGVQILGLRNAAGLRFLHVHLAGATAEELPARHRPRPVERRIQMRLGRRRLRRIDPDQEARRLLHGLLADTEGPVHIHIPRHVDDTPQTPSVLVSELQDQFTLTPAPTLPEQVRTWDDLHTAIAAGATWEDAPAGLAAQAELVRHRADPTRIGPYTGRLIDDAVRAAAAERTIGRLPHVSASRIERHAKCPHRVLWHDIARIRGIEERDEDISPLVKGNVIHEILDEWSRDLIDREGVPAAVRDPNAEAATLLRIATDRLDALYYDGIAWDAYREELLGALGTGHPYANKPPGLLKRFLDDVVERDAHVVASELAFGADEHPVALQTPAGTIRLHGKIDRVEDTPDGLLVMDLKTGNMPSKAHIQGGIHFQLPLYAHAVQTLRPDEPVHALAYYRLKGTDDGKFGLSPKVQDDADEAVLTGLLEATPRRIGSIVEAERAGHHGLTLLNAQDAGCKYCDQRLICGRRDHHVVPRRAAAQADPAHPGYVPDVVRDDAGTTEEDD